MSINLVARNAQLYVTIQSNHVNTPHYLAKLGPHHANALDTFPLMHSTPLNHDPSILSETDTDKCKQTHLPPPLSEVNYTDDT